MFAKIRTTERIIWGGGHTFCPMVGDGERSAALALSDGFNLSIDRKNEVHMNSSSSPTTLRIEEPFQTSDLFSLYAKLAYNGHEHQPMP